MAIKVSIKQVQPQKIPVKITSGTGGLLQVEHDNTLVGLGTTTVPLGINPEYTQELTDKIGTVADALANETTNREQADESLRQEIKDNTESIGNNTDAINALNTNLNAEITAREQGDAEINEAISALNSGLQAESTARADADAILQGNINSEASTRASEDAKLAADIAKNTTAISDEATARNQADAALQDSITKEATTRSNADKALQGGIDAEATARTEADAALQTSITKNAGDITTLRNDVDGLGDQVSDIEGKIPGDASTSNQLATKADVSGLETSLAKVAKTGSYNDLGDKPTIGNAVLTITRNNESAGSFAANATENQTINIAVPVSAGDVNALPDTTKYGASVSLTMDSTTYKVSASLKDQNGDVLGTVQTIDLPLESVVVSGTYDATTKEVVLTLQDGSEIRFSVADLVDGLQTEITSQNKLNADLVDDSTTVNKFVTSAEKNTWNGKQDAISDLATIRAGASKGATAVQPADLATVATSGSYNDLSNKPTIPAAQVNSDWNATSGVAQILNKPTLGTAASKDATDFATAAQGAKADTAVQPAAIADMETKTNAAATYQPKGDYATKTELATGLATKADTTTTDTLRNDVDGLGDQVQEIETKIPGDATASNQLATKADIANIDALPAQTGNAGKFLTTDGTNASWSDKPLVNKAIKSNSLIISPNGQVDDKDGGIVLYAGSGLVVTSPGSVAINSSRAGLDAICINAFSATGTNAIQIGGGVSAKNPDADTVKFGNRNGNFEIMSADGTIPSARLAADGTTGQVLAKTDTGMEWKTVSGGGSGAMPVGAIFTTPRTGTIPGAVEANGGSYNIADYSGEGSIGALLTAGSIAYVSKAEFQTRVANTGACDSFGWDGAGGTFYCWEIHEPDGTGYTTSENPVVGDTVYYVSNNYTTTVAGIITQVGSNETGSYIMWTDSATVHYRTPSKDKTKASDPTFLVPKLKPWHVGKSAPVVGNGMTLGLTDGTNYAGLQRGSVTSTENCLSASTTGYGLDVGTSNSNRSGLTNSTLAGVTTDPEKSGLVADLSETANLRVMVQLATGATDQALETCTSVLADVAGLKTDTAGIIDYVVEKQDPTSANGYTWYRKYKSGWVEQGGITTSDVNIPVVFPIEMRDNKYFVSLTSQYSPVYITNYQKATTTSIIVNGWNAGNTPVAGDVRWQVSGMSAQ